MGSGVTVVFGGGGSWGTQIPEALTKDVQRQMDANGIYVFALPDRTAAR